MVLGSSRPSRRVSAAGRMRRRGGIVVVIAHRPKALDGVDHVLVIAEGRVQSFGRKEDVFKKVLRTPAPLKVVADSQGAMRWKAG
jgi:ABC-type protease/lipase transport system fused ATPase/permease subunit